MSLVGRKNVAVFDEHRNTSRVFDVPPEAVDEARDALERFARANPRHVAWLAAGAPSIRSEADHLRWFGEPYATGRGATTHEAAEHDGGDQLVIS